MLIHLPTTVLEYQKLQCDKNNITNTNIDDDYDDDGNNVVDDDVDYIVAQRTLLIIILLICIAQISIQGKKFSSAHNIDSTKS